MNWCYFISSEFIFGLNIVAIGILIIFGSYNKNKLNDRFNKKLFITNNK